MAHVIRPEQFALLQERLGSKCGNIVVPVKQSTSSVELPFHIRKEQQDALAESMKRRFIAKAIRILPQLVPSWGEGKSESEKVEVVEEMIRFADSYQVHGEVNVLKLLLWQEEFNFRVPLIPELEFIFGRRQLSENHRMQSFCTALVSGPLLTPVSLAEDDWLEWKDEHRL